MAAQAPIQARAGDVLADKFAHDRQQVIQRQQQGLAQLHGNEFLFGREGVESVCRVTLVGEDFTPFPFVDGADAHPIAQGQDAGGFLAGGNYSAIASRAMKSGWRLESMQSSWMRHLAQPATPPA